MKKIIFLVNNPAYFVLLRLEVGLELLKKNHEVIVVGPGHCPEILLSSGFKFMSVPMTRKGKNIFFELKTVFEIFSIFIKTKPDLVHLVTIKPYLYGGIAARLAGVPAVVSSVSGLGTVFIGHQWKDKLLRAFLWAIFKMAFGKEKQKVIFQNATDLNQMADWIGLSKTKSVLIKGSGVDLFKFRPVAEPVGVPVVTFVGRLLLDKGVIEFVEASQRLKERGVHVRMCLVGEVDAGNPSSVSEAQVKAWEDDGVIEAWGFQDHIHEVYAKSNMACLPSYREGLPKSLIEAAACARAVVTTDVPGCRDAIIPGVSGLLVPVKDAEGLANAIQYLLENPEKRLQMGQLGRALAEKEFSIRGVVDEHMKIYDGLLNA